MVNNNVVHLGLFLVLAFGLLAGVLAGYFLVVLDAQDQFEKVMVNNNEFINRNCICREAEISWIDSFDFEVLNWS